MTFVLFCSSQTQQKRIIEQKCQLFKNETYNIELLFIFQFKNMRIFFQRFTKIFILISVL